MPAFAVLDVETTGFDPKRDRVVEIAVIHLDELARPVGEWRAVVNPQCAIPVDATNVHGITNEEAASQPTFTDLAPTIAAHLAGLPLIGHNVSFDLRFIAEELTASGWDVPPLAGYCTLTASKTYLPALNSRELIDCATAINHPLINAHTALADTRATAALLTAYLNLNDGPDRALERAMRDAATTPWPTGPSRPPITRPAPPAPKFITKPKAKPLIRQLATVDPATLGAPPEITPYLAQLITHLNGGTSPPQTNLTPTETTAAHHALVRALAALALHDGRINTAEKKQLASIAADLDVDETTSQTLITEATSSRHTTLTTGLQALPAGWEHGEPLRVGDRVVFTGCDPHQRAHLEQQSRAAGIRVMGSVSGLTVILVSDGTVDGGKAAKAATHGTRIVDPDTYQALLNHIQPPA